MFKSFPIQLLCAVLFIGGCNAPAPVPVKPLRNKQIILPITSLNGVLDGYKYELRRENSLQLDHLMVSTDTLHIRYWNDRGQTVDVWSKDMKTYQGVVTSYADTVDSGFFYNRPFRTFYSRVILDTASARWAYSAINSISNIPSDIYIKDWAQGYDGITFSFETSTPARYTLRTYWSPEAQNDNVQEAKQILYAVNNLDSVLNLSAKFGVLYDTLAPGDYTICHSSQCALRKLSKKEIQDMHLYEDEVRANMLSKQHFKVSTK